MATYSLPAITNEFGTYTVTTVSTVDAGAPDHQTLISLQVGEKLDFTAGDLGDMTMTLTVEEDTVAVAGGWWKEVLSGECTIAILLNDGSGDALVFLGMVNTSEVRFEELYIGTPNVRRVTIPCRTPMRMLENVSIADLITELESHAVVNYQDTGKFCSIADLIASALKLAFSQAYDVSYVSLANAGGSDFLFTQDGSGLSKICTQLYWMMMTGTGGSYAHQGFTDSTDVDYWGKNYANALELVRAVCQQFAVTPQIYYDLSDSKYKIRLLQKGRCYSISVTLPTPKMSEYSPAGGTPLSSLRVHDHNSEVHGWVWINGQERLVDIISVVTWTPPATWEPNMNIPVLWYPDEAGSWAPFAWEAMYVLNNSNFSYLVDKITVYNYSTASTTDYTTADNRFFHKALMEYLRYRYYSVGYQQYTRVYDTLVPVGGVWDDLKIMVTTTIGSDTFTIVDLDRDFVTGETRATLLELS